jgi:hypothetical protein
VFNFGVRAKPLTGLIRRAPKGRSTRTPPHVVPHPESLAAQAAYAGILTVFFGCTTKATNWSTLARTVANLHAIPRVPHFGLNNNISLLEMSLTRMKEVRLPLDSSQVTSRRSGGSISEDLPN